MALVDVLIPTYRRKTGLAVVLTGLLGQTFQDFDVIISDQTDDDETYLDSAGIRTLIGALRWHGRRVTLHRHLPRRGLAEQRRFLLEQSAAPYVRFADDDVLRAEEVEFVGYPATGLEHLDDVRPRQQVIDTTAPAREDGRPQPLA